MPPFFIWSALLKYAKLPRTLLPDGQSVMTRIGFFLFNALLIGFTYGLVYINGAKPALISYTLRNVSVPYGSLVLIMVVISTIRWFMSHDPEIAKEIVTWANALWFILVVTVLAIYLIGGIGNNFFSDLRGLMTLR